MSDEENKRNTLEKLAKEIEQKEKLLSNLNSDIQARQKTLEALNSADKSNNNQSLLETMKKLEEEVLNRDKQISSLYKRLEEASKETPRTKEANVGKSMEEMAQQWENQKVKYVEEIQNLSIELKKKNRIIEEKCKAYENTIQGLEAKIKPLEASNEEKSKEIEKLKKDLADLAQQKEEEAKYLSEKFVGLKQDLGDLIKKKDEEIGRLKERITLLNSDIEEKNQQKDGEAGALRDSVNSLEKRNEEMRRQKEEEIKLLNERLSTLNKENEILSDMNMKLRDTIKDKEGSMKKMDEDAALIRKLQDDLKIKQVDLSEARKDIEELKAENGKVNSTLGSLKHTYEEASKLVERQKNQIVGLIDDLEKGNKELKDVKKNEQERLEAEQIAKANAPKKKEAGSQTVESGLVEKKEIDTDKLNTEKKNLTKSFEEKLQVIKEENEREISKLAKLLENSEAEKLHQIVTLEEKEQRLVELERMNGTFEMLIQGLKKTILEVQERMDKNGKYLAEMQKKLDAKEAQLADLRPQISEKDQQVIMLQNELEMKEGRIAKLEKNLLQMIDEANSFKQRYKVANEKVNVISKGQIKEYEKQIASKDTEINILKEMLKSSKGVIRTKELEIQRIKQKGHPEGGQAANGSNASPLKLPRLSSENFFQKDKGRFMGQKGSEKSGNDSEFNYSINELRNNLNNLKKGYAHERESNKFQEESPRDELGQQFPEFMKGQAFPNTIKEHERILNKELGLLYENEDKERREKGGLILPEIGRNDRRESVLEEGESRIDLSQDTEARRARKNQNIFDPTNQPDQENFEISPVKVTKRKTKPQKSEKSEVQ